MKSRLNYHWNATNSCIRFVIGKKSSVFILNTRAPKARERPRTLSYNAILSYPIISDPTYIRTYIPSRNLSLLIRKFIIEFTITALESNYVLPKYNLFRRLEKYDASLQGDFR